jgi:PelA/Pel-15E family pectate lyase
MSIAVKTAALIAILIVPACASSQSGAAKNPMDSIAKLPGYKAEHDTVPLLSARRIDSLPVAERDAWRGYVSRSRAQRAIDSAAMAAELAAAGRREMEKAPYAAAFEITKKMDASWFASDTARRIARNILTYQAPNGGWSKHVDFSAPRKPGQSYFSESAQWQWISTIDNSATTAEMQFLAREDSAHPDPQYGTAFNRAVDYLLAAQFPNGCWPQVWPLAGSYHDAATFNDDATTNVLEMLRDVGAGKYPYPSAEQRARASLAVGSGVDCVVRAQYRDGGRLTAWGQQHDPLTLQPTSARSYELTSLTAQESANLMRFLMSLPAPPPKVMDAIHAVASWLNQTALYGYTFDFESGLHASPGAGPIWARMYELGTNRPIFSDRNGIKLYDWNQLNDRRHGYGWYTYAPAAALKQYYEKWKPKHPAGGIAP